jgi:hypothetical protein
MHNTDDAQIRALVEEWARAVGARDMDGALGESRSQTGES